MGQSSQSCPKNLDGEKKNMSAFEDMRFHSSKGDL